MAEARSRQGARHRKPFRRTAWVMLVGGLLLTALMLGGGWYLTRDGEPAGPGETATWPGGEEITMVRPPGDKDSPRYLGVTCVVTPNGGAPSTRALTWNEPMTPDFPGRATVSCDSQAFLLSGAGLWAVSVLRGPLVALPLVVAVLGGLLFFPRFTLAWARAANPRWIGRAVGRGRNDPPG